MLKKIEDVESTTPPSTQTLAPLEASNLFTESTKFLAAIVWRTPPLDDLNAKRLIIYNSNYNRRNRAFSIQKWIVG